MALGSLGNTIFGALAVLALIVLIAAVFRAREDGHTRLGLILAVVPTGFVAWTGAVRFIDIGGSQGWFYALAGLWGVAMIVSMIALTVLVIRSERKAVAMVAFFLFPVLGIYLGYLQLLYWAAGAAQGS